ncbi:MAG: hypothetical protein LBS61_04690 [Endomicrobium sp.]|jgi:hypothetical protein|nr:hypothetical protein [Endomicrobium sp.]
MINKRRRREYLRLGVNFSKEYSLNADNAVIYNDIGIIGGIVFIKKSLKLYSF